MPGKRGFWDVEERLRELSAEGDPLEKLGATVDFELFRLVLTRALGGSDPAKGGRPGFDPVLKFKMLVLQALHGLSLHMRFCGLDPGDVVPDANTLSPDCGKGPGQALRPARPGNPGCRVSADGRPDRCCDAGSSAPAAQRRWREISHRGRRNPGGLEGQACQASAERPRRALVGVVLEGEAEG